jgi:cytosine/adenosine deaminase-related metal-dependent hydrolase
MLQDRNRQGPIRNSIAPVGELLEEGVAVALGTDNVSDIFMPFTNGDIREEIRELARAVRWQDDLSQFADIATRNGRLVMDLPLAEEREDASPDVSAALLFN